MRRFMGIAAAVAVIVAAAPGICAAATAQDGKDAAATQDRSAPAPVRAAGEGPAQALRDGWPDTPAGITAAGWVEAFGLGTEAMREWLIAHVAPADLKVRSLEGRMKRYGELHGRLGQLMLAAVEASAPHELTVVLVAEDASRHRFRFRVAPEPPHALIQVGLLQHGPGHGGGHGAH